MKKYSIWSNIRFAFIPVWRKKRNFLWDMIIIIVFSVAVPLMASALSAMVVMLLGEEKSVATIVTVIMLSFFLYAVLYSAQAYYERKHFYHTIEVRIELFLLEIYKKKLELSLEQAESAKIREIEEKASMGVSNNFNGIEGFFRTTTELGTNVLGLFLYSLIVGVINPLLLVLLLALSIASALIAGMSNRYYEKIKESLAKEKITTEYIDHTVDDVAGGKDIRLFGLSTWLIGKYDQAIKNTRRLTFGYETLKFVSGLSDSVFNCLRNLVCYLYLISRMKHGLSISEFVFYIGVIGVFSTWFQKISAGLIKMKQCSNEIRDFRTYLDLETGMKSNGEIPKNEFTEIEIRFDHVSYQYEASSTPVLKDVSFTIKEGEHIALVGLNGAGKSTIVKLISGLYLPTTGEVYVNGISTRVLNRVQYYRHQAAIFQDAFLVSYTIGENIALSDKWDEQKAWMCLSAAGLKKKVQSLPNKLMTYLGKDVEKDGISLSGGETQKLLLARALYRNPSLVLLDEPTAAMDAIAEEETYQMYGKGLHNKTALFISHRLASTRFCDRIILLSEGVIMEQGTHNELITRKELYYELFQVQSKYYLEHQKEPELVG